MRILHTHKYFHERDGVGRYMFDLMRECAARGIATAPFAMHDARNVPSAWEKYFVSSLDTTHANFGFSTLRQAGRALWSCEAASKMCAMIAAFHPDVIHAHNIYTHLSPSILSAAHHADVPVVMTVHDYALVSANYTLWSPSRKSSEGHTLRAGRNSLLSIARSRFIKNSFSATLALECITRLQRALKMYDHTISRYITLSEFVKQTLVDVGYDAQKIDVIPPFIPLALQPTTYYLQPLDVLYVGRLEDYKGVGTLIDAMKLCPEQTLRIVGDGPCRLTFEAQAKGMTNVHFDGFLSGEKLEEAYASARVLVVPSLWYEPFGLVAVEAMARGVPVIVSDRGGLPEIVGNDQGGVLFGAGKAGDLAAAIRRFFEDEAWAAGMAGAAQTRSSTLCGLGRFEDILEIYRAFQH